MKKFLCIVLPLVLVFSLLCTPVSAAQETFVDLLNYYTPNNSGSNFVSISAREKISFPVANMFIGYVDFVIEYSGSAVYSCDFIINGQTTRLSLVTISSGLARFYGQINVVSNNGFEIQFANTNTTNLQFLSFRVSNSSFLAINLPVTGTLYWWNAADEIYYNSQSDLSYTVVNGSSNEVDRPWNADINIWNWKRFDHIQLSFMCDQLDITSISCKVGNIAIPLEYSFVFADENVGSYLVNVFIDLTSVSRVNSNPCVLTIYGTVPYVPTISGGFRITFCSGFLEQTFTNEIFVFFTNLSAFLKGQFDRIGQWFTEQTNAISSWLENIFNALSPDTEGADDAVDQAQDQANDMNDLNDQLGAMEKPDLSGGGDITGIVSSENTVKYAVFLNHVVTAPYIGQVVMLTFILALAAFVLFGKR